MQQLINAIRGRFGQNRQRRPVLRDFDEIQFIFGIVPVGIVDRQVVQKILPLKEISYQGMVDDSIARIELTQVYLNEDNKDNNVDFYFSKTLKSAFISLEAKVGDVKIFGQIKEKEQAQKEFEEAKRENKTAAYSEILQQNDDIMVLKLGNLPRGKILEIKFTYLQELSTSVDQFWNLHLPGALRPRYTPAGQKGIPSNKLTGTKNCDKFSVQLNIKCPSPIIFSKTPSHPEKAQISGTDLPNEINIELSQDMKGNQSDFVLLFRDENFNTPQISIERFQEDPETPYCARVSFVPDLNPVKLDDAYQAFISDGNEYDFDFYSKKGEFVFLLDRSGSMDGDRIDKAQKALTIFIKSLPPDSYFQVCSFGSFHSNLFDESSRKTSNESVQYAIKNIVDYAADFQGTQILEPIQEILNKELKKGYPRFIYLLTDGSVSNTGQVLNQISTQCTNEKRVYTVGIGSGCSEELIIGGAEKGNGKHIFIKDDEDMNGKIVSLLQDSQKPILRNFQFTFDKSLIGRMVPVPEKIKSIGMNDPFQCYLFLKPEFEVEQKTSFSFQFFDEQTQSEKIVQNDIEYDEQSINNSDTYHKLGIHKLISHVEQIALTTEDTKLDDVQIAVKEVDLKAFTNLSIQYQVLSHTTAFILVSPDKIYEEQIKLVEQSQLFSGQRYQEKSRNLSYMMQDMNNIKNQSQQIECLQDQCQNMSIESSSFQESSNEGFSISNFFSGLFGSKKMKKAPQAPNSSSKLNRKRMQCFEQREENCAVTYCCDEMIQPQSMKFSSHDYDNEDECVKEIKAPASISKKPDLSKIIEFQDFDGCWKLTKELVILLGFSEQEILDQKPSKLSDLNIWMTMIIIKYLEKQLTQEKSTWNLVVVKAQKWIRNQGSNDNEFDTIVEDLIKNK